MSKQPRNLNAVFGRFRRRMLAAELPTGAVERRDIDNASESARRTMPATLPDPPERVAAGRGREPRRSRPPLDHGQDHAPGQQYRYVGPQGQLRKQGQKVLAS